MFENTKHTLLPNLELLLEISRAKKCRKHSFSKKHYDYHLDSACFEQNQLRTHLKKILPIEMKPIEDPHYGIDYSYNQITIDQKFSFGALGENTIKIRVNNRRLTNKSDWTMIINKNETVELFPTKKLALFVKKNWGLVQKRLVGKKRTYFEYAIKLEELYRIENITPLRSELEEKVLNENLRTMIKETEKMLIEETIILNKTTLYKTKLLCFEPILAQIAARELLINP